MSHADQLLRVSLSLGLAVVGAIFCTAMGDSREEPQTVIDVQTLVPEGMPVRFDVASLTTNPRLEGEWILRYQVTGTEEQELTSLYIGQVVVAPDKTVRTDESGITRRRKSANSWEETRTLTQDQVQPGDRVVLLLIAAASESTLWQVERREMTAAAIALARGDTVNLPAATRSASRSGNIRPR